MGRRVGGGESSPGRYRYDPADPTPAAGGVRMVRGSGRVDNTALETRPDVLTYTTGRLDEDVEVIGEVAPRSGSAPACPTRTCSCGCATWTRAAAPATS